LWLAVAHRDPVRRREKAARAEPVSLKLIRCGCGRRGRLSRQGRVHKLANQPSPGNTKIAKSSTAIREVGRIYRNKAGRKSYGNAASLDEAKAAFRAEYLAWKSDRPSPSAVFPMRRPQQSVGL
jgi:hypothetical protein